MKGKTDSGKEKNFTGPPAKDLKALLMIFLILISLAAYYPVLNHAFHNNWDDDILITNNQRVKNGLTIDNTVWAFTTNSVGFYYPFTWLSHMTDIQLHGLHPKGHYATNIIIHCLNVVLFFLLLFISTGSQFRSFLAALLFSLHPMNVESVAWLAERKNILSTFFLLLALICYVLRFKSGSGKKTTVGYLTACYIFFIMGLMTKSSIVMFPFLLLLFDLWPLKRILPCDLMKQKQLFIEKTPFFILSFISGVLTIVAQKEVHTVISLSKITIPQRIGEALLGYGFYLEKFFLPFNLCAFYPHHRGDFPLFLPFLILAMLSFITVYFYKVRTKNPVLIMGWLFFMTSLLPVIGIIQVGTQAHADRYVYFPYWGLFIILLFGTRRENILAGNSVRKTVLAVFSLIIIFSLLFLTKAQTAKWKDDETLFSNVIQISPGSVLGYFQLGAYYLAQEKPDKAIPLFMKADELEKNNPDVLCNIGLTYMKLQNYEKALEYLDLAVKLKPVMASAHFNKACTLIKMKKGAEAMKSLDLALKNGFDAFKIQETMTAAQAAILNQLFSDGKNYGAQGKWDEAESSFRKALEISPEKADAWCYLGYILQNKKDTAGAERAYQKALALDDSLDVAVYNLALMEIQKKEMEKARTRLALLEKMNSSYAPVLRKML
jgi:protein O-mannosyl-transferase